MNLPVSSEQNHTNEDSWGPPEGRGNSRQLPGTSSWLAQLPAGVVYTSCRSSRRVDSELLPSLGWAELSMLLCATFTQTAPRDPNTPQANKLGFCYTLLWIPYLRWAHSCLHRKSHTRACKKYVYLWHTVGLYIDFCPCLFYKWQQKIIFVWRWEVCSTCPLGFGLGIRY